MQLANYVKHTILTDKPENLHILHRAVISNESQPVCNIQPLVWGPIEFASDAPWMVKMSHGVSSIILIGSDLFYEPSSFEDILVTFKSIIHQFQNHRIRMIIAYHVRSSKVGIKIDYPFPKSTYKSKQTIQPLLLQWNFKGRLRKADDIVEIWEFDS